MEREWSRTAPRAQLSTFNWNQNNYPGNSITHPTPQPIRTTNRYLILAEQHDPAVEHVVNPRDIKGTRNGLTPYHTYKGKQPQNKISARNNTTVEGGLLRNIPTTARCLVMNKGTKSIMIRNIT